MNNEQPKPYLMAFVTFVMIINIVCMGLFLLFSCTISLQNINTHGKANDIVDEEQNASADVKPSFPFSVIP